MSDTSTHDPALAALIKDLESQGKGRLLDPIVKKKKGKEKPSSSSGHPRLKRVK